MAAPFRVAQVIREGWSRYNRTHKLPPHVVRAVEHILRCRTSALGGHMHVCDKCASEVPVYNSCQSRHCPTCQTSAKEKWLAERLTEVLPVQYFHVVFTLPHALNALIDANRKLLLNELFLVVGWVLQRFAHDPQWRLQGELGYIALLHTWSQKLFEHFHLHCIVPGGVWREQAQEWVPCRGKWLFKKDSLADAFRNRYLKRLRALRSQGKLVYGGRAAHLAEDKAFDSLLAELAEVTWVVFPKPTPKNPAQALDYLARYTHKVAIGDWRIKQLKDDMVTYSWRDRADDNQEKLDTITVTEFTRRFCTHILPERFHKIRYGGWMSAPKRKLALPAIRKALHVDNPETSPPETLPERILRTAGVDITLCPHCNKGHLRKSHRLAPVTTRAP